MRDLFFHAVAGNPKVAQPLAWQAQLTLRTFGRYLSQAIHTAKQRQFRYQLPWETVREKLVVRIEPLDTRFRVMQPEPSWIVTNWPDGKEPDGGQQLMLVNKGVTLSVLHWRREGTAIRFRVDGPLDVSDQVYWCGHHCSLEQTLTPSSPSHVTLVDGQPLKLARAAVSKDSAWILWAEGDLKAEELVVDGSRLPAERLPWQPELHKLADSRGATFEFIGGSLKAEALPAEGDLRGDDGGRYRWYQQKKSGRGGAWVQLLLPESGDADDFLDPRAAFCEDEMGEVWTDERKRKETAFRVKRVDRERYQLLLDRLPPEGSTLYLPVDIRNLLLQRRALRQLMDAPLPHHPLS